MTKIFVRCLGKTACKEDDTQCSTCGRSLDEIYTTRTLVDNMVKFAAQMGYKNSNVFFEYVSAKAAKKSSFLQQQTSSNIETVKHECH